MLIAIGLVAVAAVLVALVAGYFHGRSVAAELAQVKGDAASVETKATTEGGTLLGDLRGLLKDGVIDAEHVVAYVEAKIEVEEASALSMLTHARSAAASTGLAPTSDLHSPLGIVSATAPSDEADGPAVDQVPSSK
jgi:hypothetical protein